LIAGTPSMVKVWGMMLVVSTWRVSPVTNNIFFLKLDPFCTGSWALKKRAAITRIRDRVVLRKTLNSSEFILKIVKKGLFIA